jgi:hypothetical protein
MAKKSPQMKPKRQETVKPEQHHEQKMTKTSIIPEENIEKKSINKFKVSIPFILALVLYSLIWIVPAAPPVIDPWYAAVQLVDSSKKVNDPLLKEKLLTQGGNELRELVRLYPYHARVRFFLGYYYFSVDKWDSSLIEFKEAARMDSGATINPVWPDAHKLLIKAALNKCNVLLQQKKLTECKTILLCISILS